MAKNRVTIYLRNANYRNPNNSIVLRKQFRHDCVRTFRGHGGQTQIECRNCWDHQWRPMVTVWSRSIRNISQLSLFPINCLIGWQTLKCISPVKICCLVAEMIFCPKNKREQKCDWHFSSFFFLYVTLLFNEVHNFSYQTFPNFSPISISISDLKQKFGVV